MKLIFAVIFYFFTQNYSYSQKPCRYITETEFDGKKSDLLKMFGTNKMIHPDFETQILVALSYFPELKEKKINFIYSDINTTMQCRPTFFSVFKTRSNRLYTVYINNNSNFKGVLLKDVPFNAQIGIIGHELCHILDYEKRSSLGLIKRGIDYFSHKSKKAFECEIDSLTIDKGLGWQLYDWAHFTVSSDLVSEKYRIFKMQTYMGPISIESTIKNRTLYIPTLSIQE